MAEQSFWELFREMFMPVAGSAAGGVVGYVAAKRKSDAEADAVSLDAITRHFTALIDGYEKRIDDLTTEITELRQEVMDLRKALDERTRAAVALISSGKTGH